LPITCRRPSTAMKQKSSTLKNVLRMLPDSITSRLRIVEHIILTQLRPHKPGISIPDREELMAIENHLGGCGRNPNILIVDDSVDSGATLATVVEAVRNIAGEGANIKTAVITVTTASPFVEPNFMLYRYVLCRFPWSLDFKN
jgi:phosphoribosylpyrophosphate synthetase